MQAVLQRSYRMIWDEGEIRVVLAMLVAGLLAELHPPTREVGQVERKSREKYASTLMDTPILLSQSELVV